MGSSITLEKKVYTAETPNTIRVKLTVTSSVNLPTEIFVCSPQLNGLPAEFMAVASVVQLHDLTTDPTDLQYRASTVDLYFSHPALAEDILKEINYDIKMLIADFDGLQVNQPTTTVTTLTAD